MAQTNVSIRVDEDVKKEVEELFARLGLNLSSATNVFFRQAIRAQGIPFSITAAEPKSDGGFLLREALRQTQHEAIANGISNMTLDEINEVITSAKDVPRL